MSERPTTLRIARRLSQGLDSPKLLAMINPFEESLLQHSAASESGAETQRFETHLLQETLGIDRVLLQGLDADGSMKHSLVTKKALKAKLRFST